MECEEKRVDMRIPDPENHAENVRAAQVIFRLNQTMPFTEEYRELLKELFGGNLGENSYVAAPISGACVSTMKIGKGVFINSGLLAMARGGITIEDGAQSGLSPCTVPILKQAAGTDRLIPLCCAHFRTNRGHSAAYLLVLCPF